MEPKYCAKNSPLLEALIKRAELYTKESLSAPTSIGFMMAVFDLVQGNFAPDAESKENTELIRRVAGLDVNVEKAQAFLEESLAMENTDLYDDAVYFESKMILAVVAATTTGAEEI